jgi:hypothetical protein
MCCLINKIKSWFSGKKETEEVFINEASLSKEEVDSVIINSLKSIKHQKKIKSKPKTKAKVKTKPKSKSKSKNTKR